MLHIMKEVFTVQLFEEISPLAQKLWDECSEIKQDTCSFHGERGFKVEPDADKYIHLQENDSLMAMTLRDDLGVLQGFSVSLIYQSLHHKPVKCANIDAFYVEPEYRSSIKRLIAAMEREFKSLGVVVAAWGTSPDGKMFKILNRMGYAPDDVIMEKRICALQQQ
jgi:hypothetical protein